MSRVAILGLVVLTCVSVAWGDGASLTIKLDQVGFTPSAEKVALVTVAAKSFIVKDSQSREDGFRRQVQRSVSTPIPATQCAKRISRNCTPSGNIIWKPPTVIIVGHSRSAPMYMRGRITWPLAPFMDSAVGWPLTSARNSPVLASRLSYERRLPPFVGQTGAIRKSLRLARRWRLRPLCSEFGNFDRHPVVDVGVFWPNLKHVTLNIPESGGALPDLLAEARWNLEWMFRMQDADGGVWHKQTSEKFADFIAPEKDSLPSEVIGTGNVPFKSTCATADVAAVAAIAARVYRPFDITFADRSLQVARNAWLWAEKNPNVTFRNPAGVVTGEYGDNDCADERLWAAAELWRTTGEARYQQFFVENYSPYLSKFETQPAENWAQMAPMGLWTYALSGRSDANKEVLTKVRSAAVAAAKNIAARTLNSPYLISLTSKDYVWGSNGVAASYGMQLLVANAISPDPTFTQAAAENLHYLLGRNTFSLSWVTQVGANPFRHPHHRPSAANKNAEPWPGLLSGGPNANRQDPVLKELPELPPAKIYRDDRASYASNEVAINWASIIGVSVGRASP